MIKLKKITVYKYKSIQKTQTVEIDPAITTIVGMNESGKTSFLQALAKTNYFDIKDEDFKFDIVHDFPRNQLIDFQKSEDDSDIVKCEYTISSELRNTIEEELGKDIFTATEFSYVCHYKNKDDSFEGLVVNEKNSLKIK